MKKILGIDIGGSKILALVFDGKKSSDVQIISTPKNLRDFKITLFGLIGPYLKKHKISAIGIGMAGLVDFKQGVWVASPNIKYIKNLPLTQIVKNKYYLPIKIDNDASCFARAEYFLGKAKKCANLIGITLGTGVGGGFVINGKIFRGSNNMGGEVARMFLEKDKDWEQLFQRAKGLKDYKNMEEIIGKGFSTLINLFDPEYIALTGTVAEKLHQKFLPKAILIAKKHCLNKKTKVNIYVSKLKNAPAIGAVLLFK
jgi:predicted NBD/HSP70 family sugar kinase